MRRPLGKGPTDKIKIYQIEIFNHARPFINIQWPKSHTYVIDDLQLDKQKIKTLILPRLL